jgi:type II secretory ATPase GspE/PulE/Tfp pilus assembly ATPase PilB-like protein
MTEQKTRKPLGVLLKEKGIIKEEHIAFAIQEQKITRERFGEILERLCFVTEYEVVTTLAEQEEIPFIDVDAVFPKGEVLKLFNKNSCLTHSFLPIQVEGKTIEIATASISDEKLAQLISRQTGLSPRFSLAEKKKIVNAINRLYFFVENPIEQLIEKEINLLSHDTEMARGMENLVRYLFHLAVKMRATDIHIRPMDRSINLSFRVDGVMTSVLSRPIFSHHFEQHL